MAASQSTTGWHRTTNRLQSYYDSTAAQYCISPGYLKFADGSTAVMARRERPHVITDEKGDVLVLYTGTGVEDPSRPDGRPDLSYTYASRYDNSVVKFANFEH